MQVYKMKKYILLISGLMFLNAALATEPNKLNIKINSCSFIDIGEGKAPKLSPSISFEKNIKCELNEQIGSTSYYSCQQTSAIKVGGSEQLSKDFELVNQNKELIQLVNKFPNIVITINKINGNVMIIKSTLPKLTQAAEVCSGSLVK